MGIFSSFGQNMNWMGLVSLLLSAAAALLCITVHELSHGWVAFRLGDPTAKRAGRLTLNPVRHIDPFGLLMLIVAKVGWAKPVPIDMRYFKDPRKGMALTALAGPLSNFILAFLAVALSSVIWRTVPDTIGRFWVLAVLSYIALLSTGLGLFNLIPIPPLDGSKVLFSFFSTKIYYTILRYEKYIMIAVMLLTFSGAFQGPLSYLINGVLRNFCAATGYPIRALVFHVNLLDYIQQY
ncbi:MAG: site-2 protease family protein [Intestinimonas sp.]|jgi:Zn-dependent protease|nr:site-2 protease family protein [Intestinimonas sp.]